MTRSLVIAPQWVGDAVMCEPLLARLAARGERLTVAALPGVLPVFRAMPQVAETMPLAFSRGTLEWAARRALARTLQGRFDAAYVLPNSLKSALIPWLARIPRRVGYHGEGRWVLLTERRPNPGGRPPMVPFYAALSGAPGAADERPRLQLAPEAVAQAAAGVGVEPGGYFAFAPGAEYGPAKCWPAEHYADLARRLHARHGLPVLLLGSPKEAGLAEGIAAAAGAGCRSIAGKTSLDAALALIAGARGIVSNDSGLMHVGAAFGVPQVAVFGSTSPHHTPPLNERARVLWLKDELGLACMPCFERTCRFGHYGCLQGVSPERADGALHDALAAA